jgi:ribose transport system ATP-binding protein
MITLADRILVMRDFLIVGEVENNRRYEPMSRRIMNLIHSRPASEGSDAERETTSG